MPARVKHSLRDILRAIISAYSAFSKDLAKEDYVESPETTYEGVIQIITGWPAHQRFTLVHEVLKTLEPETGLSSSRTNTLPQALGLLATNQPSPTDADVTRLLHEHRMERYG